MGLSFSVQNIKDFFAEKLLLIKRKGVYAGKRRNLLLEGYFLGLSYVRLGKLSYRSRGQRGN